MIPKTSDVGVVIGRFQVHRLHGAHESLIQSVVSTHRQTLIVLGLSPTRVTTRNPLDFEARKQMLVAAFPAATVLYLKDEPTDEGWSAKLDTLLADYVTPSQTVCLYGGRDSFIGHYKGQHQVDVLEPDHYLSGTELRKSIAKSVKGTEDFRAGVIWAAANGYPKVFPTIDVGIWRPSPQGQVLCAGMPTAEWLLVRKPTEQLWRFPGGFVSPIDASLEAAARREVFEETGVSVQEVNYLWSGLVEDWRYRDEVDKIMTTLFLAPYVSGPVRPADDVAEASWFPRLAEAMFVPEHRRLLKAMRGEQ